jgi:CelD/BcsL family acetyltransferase involved in cellulose biosynthesis
MIEVITDRDRFSSLNEAWDALATHHNSPLLTFDWFASCVETVHAADPLRIVTVWEGDKLTAIAPLCLVKQKGIATLVLLGTTHLYEPSGFLFADQRSLARLLDGVTQLGYPLTLLRLPGDPVLLACLTKLAWRKGTLLKRQTASSSFLSLPEDWNGFLQDLSPSRRYDFRRKRKSLDRAGHATTRIVSPTMAELPALLHSALVVEDRSWKGQQGSSLLKNKTLLAFFENFARRTCEAGLLRLCFLDLDGEPISMHIALLSHGRLWILKLGFDEALAKCSPGTQLAMDTIEYSVQQRLAGYEFLGSAETWQLAWPVEAHTHFAVLFYPYSLRGFAGLAAFLLSYGKKTLMHWVKRLRCVFRVW